MQSRKTYAKPQIEKVELRMKEMVLALGCKVDGASLNRDDDGSCAIAGSCSLGGDYGS